MKKNVVKLLFFFLLLLIPSILFGQMNRMAVKKNNKRITNFMGHRIAFNKRYNFVGLSVNAFNYLGDLAPLSHRMSTDIVLTRPGFGIVMARRLGPRYTLQAQFLYGTIRGSDADSADPFSDQGKTRFIRNLSFRNRIKELSVLAYFDLFANRIDYLNRRAWTPYLYLGAALILHDPKAQVPKIDLEGNVISENGKWISLRSLGTEGQYANLQTDDANYGIRPYRLLVLAIPLGIGSRFKLSDRMDIWIEIGLRYTFTDYLDDVSKNYVDLGVLNSPLSKVMSYRSSELGLPTSPVTYQGRDQIWYTVQNGYGQEQAGNVRGNKSENDMYTVTSLRLTHIISPSFKLAKHR